MTCGLSFFLRHICVATWSKLHTHTHPLQLNASTHKPTPSFPLSAHSVMVNIIGNGHGDPSSNPGQDCLPFA